MYWGGVGKPGGKSNESPNIVLQANSAWIMMIIALGLIAGGESKLPLGKYMMQCNKCVCHAISWGEAGPHPLDVLNYGTCTVYMQDQSNLDMAEVCSPPHTLCLPPSLRFSHDVIVLGAGFNYSQ